MLRIHHAFCDATANVRVWRTWGTAAQRDALARREDLRAPTGAAPAISGPNFEFRGAICGRLKLVAGPYNATNRSRSTFRLLRTSETCAPLLVGACVHGAHQIMLALTSLGSARPCSWRARAPGGRHRWR